MKRVRTFLIVVGAALVLAEAGCSGGDNSLEGSLSSQYDLSFDSVRARQYTQSRQLSIEYLRGEGSGEEKPITVTIMPTPDGPGTFTLDAGQINFDNSLAPGSPELPSATQGSVDLDVFTPDESGSDISGSIHGMFTNLGTGDAFSLEGSFETTLTVMP